MRPKEIVEQLKELVEWYKNGAIIMNELSSNKEVKESYNSTLEKILDVIPKNLLIGRFKYTLDEYDYMQVIHNLHIIANALNKGWCKTIKEGGYYITLIQGPKTLEWKIAYHSTTQTIPGVVYFKDIESAELALKILKEEDWIEDFKNRLIGKD